VSVKITSFCKRNALIKCEIFHCDMDQISFSEMLRFYKEGAGDVHSQ
jgi:hypothetical protein